MEGAESDFAPEEASPAWVPERQHRLLWWKEAIIVAAFYGIYSWTRNLFGSNKIAADGIPEQAFTNAERVIQFELWLGLYHEATVQGWFLPYRTFIQFWNVYYGTLHFIITIGVIVLLCYGAFELVEKFIRDPKIALAAKIGVVALSREVKPASRLSVE